MRPTALSARAMGRGFTLVEVLVALTVVALGLTALMVAVSGTARTSGYLRDKTIAQWIALDRLAQVRLLVNKLGDNQDTGQIDFAGRKWHYDTRYFATQFPSMRRIVVRVYPGDANTKGNPLSESTGFFGTSLAIPGMSNVDWTQGSTLLSGAPCATSGPSGTPGPVGANSALNMGAPQVNTAQGTNCIPGANTPATIPGTIPNNGITTPPGQTTP